MLSAADIAGMRSTMDSAMPDTVSVERASYASDGQGGKIATWSTLATVSGRVSPFKTRGDEEPEVAGAVRSHGLWQVTMPHGTDVTPVDRIVFGTATLQVQRVEQARSWSLGVRAYCVKVA